MRKALNDNPVVQVVVLCLLALVVGVLLLTRVMHKSGSSAPTPASTTSAATPAPTAGSTATGSTAGTTPATTTPSSTAPVAPSSGGAVPPTASAGTVPAGKLVAGPGLPKPVAAAYADDRAIVLFVFSDHGIDDVAVRSSVERLRGRSDLAVFITQAAHIARYARITEGVNVNRVPALIVVRPRHLTQGEPTASVSYGFRGPDSVDQAVRDALYRGPTNLPYYPK
jgi:hypothetical protein